MAVTIITGIPMVHSIPTVTETNKGNSLGHNQESLQYNVNKFSFPKATVLKENEAVRTDSNNFCFTTYGMDRQLRFSDYPSREYHH